ncbi:uncharacterized protein LOC126998881 [Eriocheir sinensis]|uniref:uncharacterized protein LOC126998881 n=1 Tax=Eriocheir sinensis TaxID=95602 RepID=UPI0021C8A2E4|nr:uncharacterized protein LOC126998881 [Eriocheir sinensis]
MEVGQEERPCSPRALYRIDDDLREPNASQSCSRRYSEVVREYLQRRQQRGDETDEHNIKPSEVVTHQADHAGPNGATYVSWGNPETPGMVASCVQPVPVMEDLCAVHEVQEVHFPPRLSPFSPVTPESGAESYTTAKTHLSSHIPSQSPRSRSRSQVPVGVDSLQAKHCKAPLINIFSAGGSARFHTFRHPRQDEDDDSDFELQPPLPMNLLQSGRVDSNGSLITDGISYCSSTQSSVSPSRTFVITPRAMNDETVVNEWSVMRDEDCQVEESLINPVTLDFERNSCLESDPSLCDEEHIGELAYPPEETDISSYKLKSKSPQSCESEGSSRFSWFSSTRKASRQNIAEEDKKLQRLQVFCWVVVAVGFLLLVASVCLYFVLD